MKRWTKSYPRWNPPSNARATSKTSGPAGEKWFPSSRKSARVRPPRWPKTPPSCNSSGPSTPISAFAPVADCASTDANIPLSLGFPAIAIGAGGAGGGAHTTNEWYRHEGRDLGLKRIFLTLLLLMRYGGGAR